MEDTNIQKVACIMASLCTNSSKLSEYCEKHNISQQEFFDIKQQTTNRLYTMLTYLLTKPVEEYANFMTEVTNKFNPTWQEPFIEEALIPKKSISNPDSKS